MGYNAQWQFVISVCQPREHTYVCNDVWAQKYTATAKVYLKFDDMCNNTGSGHTHTGRNPSMLIRDTND